MDKNKRRYTIIGIIVVAILLVIGIGHHVAKTGGLIAPKTVSLKSPGERVWLSTEDGLQKDALVDYIDVVKGNKFIQYQVFDDNITLGKASKMSNQQLISLGKKQDRKYFDKSADEVKALRDNDDQIGLQNDLMGDNNLKGDLNQGAWIVLTGTRTGKTRRYNRVVPIDDYEQESQKVDTERAHQSTDPDSPSTIIDKSTEHDEITDAAADRNGDSTYNKRNELSQQIRNERFNALLDNMKSVKYLAPKWQTLSFKNSTDDSGNKIVSQKVSYKNIDEFNDAGTMDENVTQNLTDSQKQKLLKMKDASDSKDFYNLAATAFDKSYYKAVTKNVFKPHTIDDEMTLSNTVHQKIYDTNYIGYQFGDDNYLVTKAQNDNQRAVFAK